MQPAAAESMRDRIDAYFGRRPGGVDLRAAMAALPLDQVEALGAALARRRGGPGRAIFFGNGGSFDNARLLASRCRAHGIPAKVPGHTDDYLAVAQAKGYEAIYANGLEQDGIGPADMVIGISGSGNSPNVVRALELAKARGSEAWCLGGRDGGAMRPVCGDARALIGRNQCMEAIEDLHVAMVAIALEGMRAGDGVRAAHARWLAALDAFMAPANLARLADAVARMLGAIGRGGRCLVLGTGIGAGHIRADLGRGATNAVPIRGIAAPEFFSLNSAQATANDDGLDFVLVDGLVKVDPAAHDVALLCESPAAMPALAHCRDVLEAAGTPCIAIGPGGIDCSAFHGFDEEVAFAMLGHAAGECIRAALHQEWRARRLEGVAPALPPGQKKLGVRETVALESGLRARGTIAAGEQIAFCYGGLWAVTPPPGAPPRCFF